MSERVSEGEWVRKTYQTIKGFGNAFTDAAALNFAAMAPEVQRTLLDQYWGSAGGMQYTIGRIPIGSCDFSTHVYSYDDHPGDVGLKKFSIDSEPEEKLALIRRAIANANASDISLFRQSVGPSGMDDVDELHHRKPKALRRTLRRNRQSIRAVPRQVL